MPGTIVFKPIEATLTHNTELIGKMDPYCLFHVGTQKIKGQVCRKGGKHPQWEDSVVVPVTDQPICTVDLKDKDIIHDDKIGTFEIDLREIETQGKLKKWYPLFYKEKPAGEILVESVFTGNTVGSSPSSHILGAAPTTFTGAMPPVPQGGIVGQSVVTETIVSQPYVVNQVVTGSYTLNQGALPTGNIYGSQGAIQTGNIYGSQGLAQGTNVLPIVGGSYPQTHSHVVSNTALNPDHYAQEALLRGVDPLNVSSVNAYNSGLHGSQGLGQGPNVLPIVGGSFPQNHSSIVSNGLNPDHYAQEALLRGVDPLNVSGVNAYNSQVNGGIGLNQHANLPINATSQLIPGSHGHIIPGTHGHVIPGTHGHVIPK